MVGMLMFLAIKPVCLNKFGFGWSVIRLMPLSIGLFGHTTERKNLVLEAAAIAFPIGAERLFGARCFRNRKDLSFTLHIAARAVPESVFRG